MKLLSLVVPCYNSQDYLERCIDSLLPGGDELEILIVDDGSTDATPAMADRMEKDHPGLVRAIHQENGGHGEALNTGLRHAQGLFFKSVDSDDRLDSAALVHLLEKLRALPPDHLPDLIINDYVYDQVGRDAVFSVRYQHVFRPYTVQTWDEAHAFPFWKQFMIHSMAYRTALLRDMPLVLPAHTFYEDNLYIYQPLPYVRSVYYFPEPLYGYFIGRPDQSIHEDIILRRLDQCTAIAGKMICSYTLAELEKLPSHLYHYMINNAAGQLFSTCSLQFIDWENRGRAMYEQLWKAIHDFDPRLEKKLKSTPVGWLAAPPGAARRSLLVFVYRTGRKIINFS